VDRLLEHGADLQRAFLMNKAFAAPEALTTAQREHDRALDTPPGGGVLTLDQARDIAARMEEKVRSAKWSAPQPLYGGPHGG
jgi:hypothetical protein